MTGQTRDAVVARPLVAMLALLDAKIAEIVATLDKIKSRRHTERNALCGRLIVGERGCQILVYFPD